MRFVMEIGPPKGVMLTHSSICSNLYQMTRPGYVDTNFFEPGGQQEHLIGILPFFHIFGFTVVMASTLYQGSFTRTLPKFDPQSFIQAIREHKVSSVIDSYRIYHTVIFHRTFKHFVMM